MIAMLFSMTAMTHGFFLFPLIWLAFFLMSSGGGGHRRGWVDPTGTPTAGEPHPVR